MDPSERLKSLYIGVQSMLRAGQADIFTALPATVVKFNTTGELTVSAQPTVQYQQRKPDGTWNYLTLPQCIHCPVIFPGGGGFVFSFPLAVGDEGLLIFASRCIDNWWQQGGVQTQAELRMHDISDGFFLPVCFSQPNTPTAVSTTNAQLRTLDGTTVIDMDPIGHKVSITAPGGIILNGPLQVSGPILGIGGGTAAVNFETSGDVIAGKGTGDQVGLQTHKHPTAGTGAPSSPTPGT